MSYYFSKTMNMDFDAAIEYVTEKLKENGFGILTEIDVNGSSSFIPDSSLNA